MKFVFVSSPNTPGLRQLQEERLLGELLSSLNSANRSISANKGTALKDIYLKISPDIDDMTLKSVYEICTNSGVTAVIATNTTLSRINLKTNIDEQGGLSGKPLTELSDRILASLRAESRVIKSMAPKLIGVGGVFSKDDYERKLLLGASLVQVYTGFIYEGPGIIRNILNP